MLISPSHFDLWCARQLTGILRWHTELNVGIQRGIESNVLGGLWFGLALFVFWVLSARKDQTEVQIRIWTILFGSTLAILLTLVLGALISWPPPVHYPALRSLYVGLLEPNPNTSSFPSQSVALYASVAMGIYSLKKSVGVILWILVVIFVAIPRMIVGGHYVTDILVGCLLAIIGYLIARHFLERKLTGRLETYLSRSPRLQLIQEVLIFLWIIQVTVEFQGVTWFRNFIQSIVR